MAALICKIAELTMVSKREKVYAKKYFNIIYFMPPYVFWKPGLMKLSIFSYEDSATLY